MGQVSAVLRSVTGGYMFFCPGCQSPHVVGVPGWSFDGNLDRPTFSPSIKVTYNGRDADQSQSDGSRVIPSICHSFVCGGRIEFCTDSTHAMSGQSADLPPLPAAYAD